VIILSSIKFVTPVYNFSFTSLQISADTLQFLFTSPRMRLSSPAGIVLNFAAILVGIAQTVKAFGGLSDFGGDVSQYMSLLQGSSAFRHL
jgi:hypothetical protein